MYDPAACPVGKKVKTFKSFVFLSDNDAHCLRVDRERGFWAFCSTCNKNVIYRDGRESTLARWNDHKTSPEHKNHIRRLQEIKLLELKKKKYNDDLAPLEKSMYDQLTNKKSPLLQFYNGEVSNWEINKKNQAIVGTNKSIISPTPPLALSQENVSPHRKPTTCEGIMPNFCGNLKDSLCAYELYAAIDYNSKYKFGKKWCGLE